MNERYYIDTDTNDIVTISVAYMRLSLCLNYKVSDYIKVENGNVTWIDYPRFEKDMLHALGCRGVNGAEDKFSFASKYMFGYYNSDEVLESDILNRFLNNELDEENNADDIELINADYKCRAEIEARRDWLDSNIFLFALYDWFIRRD